MQLEIQYVQNVTIVLIYINRPFNDATSELFVLPAAWLVAVVPTKCKENGKQKSSIKYL